jgi:putative acetyltransferase
VRDIRADACYRPDLAWVAVDDGEIIAHTMLSDALIVDGDTTHRILVLSPMAVDPSRQRTGVGQALIRAVTARADELGEPLVVLEGVPAYYPRVGFVVASTLGIEIALPDWAPPEAAQALPLSAWTPAMRGRVVMPQPFAGLD